MLGRLPPQRLAALVAGRRFYDPATPLAWRWAYLDSIGADYVLLRSGGGALLGGDQRAVQRLALPLLEIWQVMGPRDFVPRPPGS